MHTHCPSDSLYIYASSIYLRTKVSKPKPQLTLPISNSPPEQHQLVLTSSTKVINKEVAKHLASDTALPHELGGGRLEGRRQVDERFTSHSR